MSTAVILAGGDAHRFSPETPAALQWLAGEPVLSHVLRLFRDFNVGRTIVVANLPKIKEILPPSVEFVLQADDYGSGDALRCAQPFLGEEAGDVFVAYANRPLFQPATLKALVQQRRQTAAAGAIASVVLQQPCGHARVMRGSDGVLLRARRDCEASPDECKIKEVVAGLYCFEARPLLDALTRLAQDAPSYLFLNHVATDIAERQRVTVLPLADPEEALGIYSDNDLRAAEAFKSKFMVR